MNATEIVRVTSRTPVLNLGVLILAGRYVVSRLLSNKVKTKIKVAVKEMKSDSAFLRYVITSVIWSALSISILAPFDCARTRFAAGRKKLRLRLNRSSVISVLLAVAGMSIYRTLSYILYTLSKKHLKESSTTTRFLMEFVLNSVAGTATYPIDTIRRMYFLESRATQGLTTSMLFRGVWVNLIRCFVQALLLFLMKLRLSGKRKTSKKHSHQTSPSTPPSRTEDDTNFKTPNPQNRQPWRRRGRRVART